jgi:hypothetical protein
VLIPTLLTAFVVLLVGILLYKCQVGGVIAQMRLNMEKRVPPGADREITLVLTDVQVGASGMVIKCLMVHASLLEAGDQSSCLSACGLRLYHPGVLVQTYRHLH